MKKGKVILTTMYEYLNEQNTINKNDNIINFDLFPEDILKTLKNEYSHYYSDNFDWNSKQDEFTINGIFDGKGFSEWLNKNETEGFLKNLDKLIQKTRQDLILLIKQRNADKILDNFEELIIPVLGDSVLCEPLNKFMEFSLMNLHSIKDIELAYKETKNIIDSDGSLNFSKITPSKIFIGDSINLQNFERFVKENPDYIGVFKHWKKMFDKSIDLSLKDLHAFRNSTTYKSIKDLYNFLVNFKEKLKLKQ